MTHWLDLHSKVTGSTAQLIGLRMDLAVNLNINGAIFPDVESHLSTIKILIQTSPAPENLGDAEDPYFIHLEDSEERRVCVLVLLSLKNKVN